MSFVSKKSTIRVVGANPNGGGVLTFVKNLASDRLKMEIYGYREYLRFISNIQKGDTIFFNVIKPSIPFLFIVTLIGRTQFHLVYCGHGLNYKNNNGARRIIVRFFEKWLSKRMNKVIVINGKDLSEFRKWNENSFVLPTYLKPKNRPQKSSTNVSSDSVSWVAVGKVEGRKDPNNFIEIARTILEEYPNDRFTWIGEGPLLPEMKYKSANIAGCNFIGGIENDHVREHLFETNIFLCTSTFEVLPMSILEAVEAGCILVVRNYYYSSDVGDRFKSSFIYRSVDEIMNLRQDSGVLKRLKSYAIEHQAVLEEEYNEYINNIASILCLGK